jgi:Tol biopolymer transport system component
MFPSWSPDGSKIIFASTFNGFDAVDYNIFTIDANVAAPVSVLGGLTQLTTNIKSDKAPVYSADGSQIYWHTDQLGDIDIWAMGNTGVPKGVRLWTASTEECPNYRW